MAAVTKPPTARDNSGQGHDPASPYSSDEPLEGEGDDKSQRAQWDKSTSPVPGQPAGPRISGPLQKRRRVTRACDECRRKKIKCDGRMPCSHCEIYSYGKFCNVGRGGRD
jgi:hypothetical protein